MKKIYLCLIAGIVSVALGAQCQRTVLVEEFTQASCGPCAAANPALHTLLTNNASKSVYLKYQVSWPGVDPMNAQYPSVSTRATYYSCNSVPYAVMDGVAVTGASYTGYPGNLTQTKINTEYAITSPFYINVSHFLNAAQDSITINVTYTASQDFTGINALRGHLALVEKHIDFASPPGSNGETDFYNVCRRMYPGPGGQLLSQTWTAGQDTSFYYKYKLPTYIYDINQLALICWVQDNGNKSVLQASESWGPVGVHTYTNAPSAVNLFPNPAKTNATLSFILDGNAKVVVNIYSVTGAMISTENKGLMVAGKHELPINIDMLTNGMYFVELVADDQKAVKSLHVVH